MNRKKDSREHASSRILHKKPTVSDHYGSAPSSPQNAHNKEQIEADNMQQDSSDRESCYTPPLPAGLVPKQPRFHSGKGKPAASNQSPNKHRKHQESSGLCNKHEHRRWRELEDVDHPRFPVDPNNSTVTQDFSKRHQMIPLNINRVETLDNKKASSKLIAKDRQAYANQRFDAYNGNGKGQQVAPIERMRNRTNNRYATSIRKYTQAYRAHPYATAVLYVSKHFKDCSDNDTRANGDHRRDDAVEQKQHSVAYDAMCKVKDGGVRRNTIRAEIPSTNQYFKDCCDNGKNREVFATERMHNRTIKEDHPPSKADTRAGGDHIRTAAVEQTKDGHRYTEQHSVAYDAIGKVRHGGVRGNAIGAEIPVTNQENIFDKPTYLHNNQHFEDSVEYGKGQGTYFRGRMYNRTNPSGADTKAGADRRCVYGVDRCTTGSTNQRRDDYDEIIEVKDVGKICIATGAEIPQPHQCLKDCVEYGKGQDTSVRGRIYNRANPRSADTKASPDRRSGSGTEQNISGKSSDCYNSQHSVASNEIDEGTDCSTNGSAVLYTNQRHDDYNEIVEDKDVIDLRAASTAEVLKQHQLLEDCVEYGMGQDTSVRGWIYNRANPRRADTEAGPDRRSSSGAEQNISGKSSDRYNSQYSVASNEIVEGRDGSTTGSAVSFKKQRRDDYDEIAEDNGVKDLRIATEATVLKPHQHFDDCVEYGKDQDTSVIGRMYNRSNPNRADTKTGADRRRAKGVEENVSGRKVVAYYAIGKRKEHGDRRSTNGSAVSSSNQRRDEYDEVGDYEYARDRYCGTGAKHTHSNQYCEDYFENAKGQGIYNREMPNYSSKYYVERERSPGEAENKANGDAVEQIVSGSSVTCYEIGDNEDRGDRRSSSGSAVCTAKQRCDDYDEIGEDKNVRDRRCTNQYCEHCVEKDRGQGMFNHNRPKYPMNHYIEKERATSDDDIGYFTTNYRYSNQQSYDEIGEDKNHANRHSSSGSASASTSQLNDYEEFGDNKVVTDYSATETEVLYTNQHFEDYVESKHATSEDSIEKNVSAESSQSYSNQQSIADDKFGDDNDHEDGFKYRKLAAWLVGKGENVVEVPPAFGKPTNDFLDRAPGNAASSNASSITRFKFCDDADFKKQVKLMVDDAINDILAKQLQGEENQVYLNLFKEIVLRNKTSSKAASNIGKKASGRKISGNDLSAIEIETIKVLAPIHDKLHRMYVKHRRDELSIIEDLINVPSAVKKLCSDGIKKKKKK